MESKRTLSRKRAVEMARVGAPMGGQARAAAMTVRERRQSAKKAALARWAGTTKVERSAAAKEAWEKMTPAERSAMGRARWAKMRAEGRAPGQK